MPGPGFGGPPPGGPGFGGPPPGGPRFGGPGGPGWGSIGPWGMTLGYYFRPGVGPAVQIDMKNGAGGDSTLIGEAEAIGKRAAFKSKETKNPFKIAGFALFGGAGAALYSLRHDAQVDHLNNSLKDGRITQEEFDYRMAELNGEHKKAKLDHDQREALFNKKQEEINELYMAGEISYEEAERILMDYQTELNGGKGKGHSK